MASKEHKLSMNNMHHIHDLHVGKLLLLDLVDGGGAGLHIVPPGGHQRGAQGAEQRLKVCLVSGAGRGAYLVISLGQLRDGGEGGGHPDHREERGVGGREHVEQDHAGEAHQEEDQPSGDACRLILSILDDRKIRSAYFVLFAEFWYLLCKGIEVCKHSPGIRKRSLFRQRKICENL